jgi:CheY-like chemotaxis protein
LLVADSSSVVLALNAAAIELVGEAGEEVVGLKVSHLLRPEITSAELTEEGVNFCYVVDGDLRLTCITRCVGGYSCLNVALAEDVAAQSDLQSDADWRTMDDKNSALSKPSSPMPLEAAQPSGSTPADSEVVDADGEELGLHVLFCDDDQFQADVMTMLCATNSYEMTHFSHGPDAIDALRRVDEIARPYNLVLLDLNMQPMHGLEVLKQIRKFNRSITVIIITATEDDSMVKACIQHGANSYIVKPVRDKDVRNIGHFALEASKVEKRRRRARVRNAISSVLTTRFAIVFLPLRALQAEGRLISHEEARSKGLLVQCDTYDEVAEFIRIHPTAFFSHQVRRAACKRGEGGTRAGGGRPRCRATR